MGSIYLGKLDIIYNSTTLINPFKKGWENNFGTNCYAYALGIDIPVNCLGYSDDRIHYTPGYFGGKMISRYFSKEELLASLLMDLDRFDLCSFPVNPSYRLKKGEWKIAVFGAKTNTPNEYNDFHFLRQTKNGIWMHKQGFNSEPKDTDSDNMKIISPFLCRLEDNDDDEVYSYEYFKTLVLSK